jgi:hypothetical protein
MGSGTKAGPESTAQKDPGPRETLAKRATTKMAKKAKMKVVKTAMIKSKVRKPIRL